MERSSQFWKEEEQVPDVDPSDARCESALTL